MINLTPIAKPIQERLFEMMKVLGRKKTPPGEERTDPKEHLLEMKDLATRTTFIRMISGQKQPVIMMGGELSDDKEIQAGYTDIYDSIFTTEQVRVKYGYESIITEQNKFKRPPPGIKSIDVQFKGGVRALRQASISWTCWTFDDLERLRTHFLSHGKTVALEWGWVYDKNEFIKVMSDYSLIEEDDQGRFKLKDDAFSDHRMRIFKEKGDFDFMVGIVKNFEFSSRDDGGFDCKTDIISTGVNLFDMDSSQGSSSDRMKLFDISERDDVDTKIRKLREFKEDPNKLVNIYYNNNLSFSLFLEQFDKWLAYEFNLKNRMSVGNFNDYLVEPGKFIAQKALTYKAGVESKNVYNKVIKSHEIWVKWGWFEDTILNQFVSFLSWPPTEGATKETSIINEFRSIEPMLDADGKPTNKFESTKIRNHKFLQTTNYRKFILPGQFSPLSTKFLEDATLAEVDQSLPAAEHRKRQSGEKVKYTGEHKAFGVAGEPGVTITGDTLSTQNLGKVVNDTDNFGKFETDTFRHGYLRNILFNVEFLKQQFSYIDRTTIKTGFDNLFNAMNQDINFWDLQLTNDEHEPKRTKIIDNNTTHYDWDDAFDPLEEQTDETDGKVNTLGVFHFPVWQHDSFVKSQNLTAKLPNAMQIAAMYGANADAYTNMLGSDENFAKEGTRTGALGKDGKDMYIANAELAMRVGESGAGVVLGTKDGDPNKSLLSGDGVALVGHGVADIINSLTQDITSEVEKLIKSKENDDTEKPKSVYTGRLISPEVLGVEKFWQYLHDIADNSNISDTDLDRIFHTFAYKYNANGDLKKPFVRQMDYMVTKQGNKKSADLPILIPLELELTISGIGGIYPGNSFHSSYVPPRYVNDTIFQAFNVNHTVDSTGWTVSITGKMRCTLSGLYENVYKEDEKLEQLWKELAAGGAFDQPIASVFGEAIPESNTEIDVNQAAATKKPIFQGKIIDIQILPYIAKD